MPPPYAPYTPKAIDTTQLPSTSTLAGITAIVTGGASGIGEGYVRASIDAARAAALEAALGPRAKFILLRSREARPRRTRRARDRKCGHP
jgi:hypothetical protein